MGYKKYTFILTILLSIYLMIFSSNAFASSINIQPDWQYLRKIDDIYYGKKQIDKEKLIDLSSEFWWNETYNDFQNNIRYFIEQRYGNNFGKSKIIPSMYYLFEFEWDKVISSIQDYMWNELSFSGSIDSGNTQVKLYFDSFYEIDEKQTELYGYDYYYWKYDDDFVYKTISKPLVFILSDEEKIEIDFQFYVPQITTEGTIDSGYMILWEDSFSLSLTEWWEPIQKEWTYYSIWSNYQDNQMGNISIEEYGHLQIYFYWEYDFFDLYDWMIEGFSGESCISPAYKNKIVSDFSWNLSGKIKKIDISVYKYDNQNFSFIENQHFENINDTGDISEYLRSLENGVYKLEYTNFERLNTYLCNTYFDLSAEDYMQPNDSYRTLIRIAPNRWGEGKEVYEYTQNLYRIFNHFPLFETNWLLGVNDNETTFIKSIKIRLIWNDGVGVNELYTCYDKDSEDENTRSISSCWNVTESWIADEYWDGETSQYLPGEFKELIDNQEVFLEMTYEDIYGYQETKEFQVGDFWQEGDTYSDIYLVSQDAIDNFHIYNFFADLPDVYSQWDSYKNMYWDGYDEGYSGEYDGSGWYDQWVLGEEGSCDIDLFQYDFVDGYETGFDIGKYIWQREWTRYGQEDTFDFEQGKKDGFIDGCLDGYYSDWEKYEQNGDYYWNGYNEWYKEGYLESSWWKPNITISYIDENDVETFLWKENENEDQNWEDQTCENTDGCYMYNNGYNEWYGAWLKILIPENIHSNIQSILIKNWDTILYQETLKDSAWNIKTKNSEANEFSIKHISTKKHSGVLFGREINFFENPASNEKWWGIIPQYTNIKPTIEISGENINTVDKSKLFICITNVKNFDRIEKNIQCFRYDTILSQSKYIPYTGTMYIFGLDGVVNSDFETLKVRFHIQVDGEIRWG